jgi:hypothetical protein
MRCGAERLSVDHRAALFAKLRSVDPIEDIAATWITV